MIQLCIYLTNVQNDLHDTMYKELEEVCNCFKGACSDPQPHPPTSFKHMEILVSKVESYLEGFMCEILCAK